MRIEYFRYLLNQINGFYLLEDVIMFRKPLEIYDVKTGESKTFKTVDEALQYEIKGETVRSIIERTENLDIPSFNGGRGSGSGGDKEFGFGHVKDAPWDAKSNPLFPARANTQIKTKNFESALSEFRKQHATSDHEYAYEVDSNGYVSQYVEGATGSVGIGTGRNSRNTMILHNHPNNSAFSDTDLISTAMDRRSKGIVASGKTNDYIFEKGTHFKANSFIKAVKTAKMKGKDYDSAVDGWLRKNQSKYGFKYKRIDRKKQTTNSTTKKTKTKSTTAKSGKEKNISLTSPRGKKESYTFRKNKDGSTDILRNGKAISAYKNVSFDEFKRRATLLGYK